MGDSAGGGRFWPFFTGVLVALGFTAQASQARPWVAPVTPSATTTAATAPAPNAASGLRVLPFPGTPDASPSSAVIFSALRLSDLGSVTVTGSRSGRHPGRLTTLPAGAGVEFKPNRRFTPGELVRVIARLTNREAGRAVGVPHGTRLSFSFQVGLPVSGICSQGQRSLSTGIGPTQHFRSEPHLRPPVVNVTGAPDQRAGDIFLAMQRSPQVGPMIMNGHGQLVWFHPIGTASGALFASDLAVQRYQGHPVLTWWQGDQVGAGQDVLMNRSYRTVAVVHAGDGYQADLHEFQLTPRGGALLDAVGCARANLTGVGGPRSGTVLDDVIQAIDVRTGKVLWEWHALGHVPLSASYKPYSSQKPYYDYFHLNSIQQLPNGNLLISARFTWAVYEISWKTGRVIWTLGGKYSNFDMGPGTNFEWQHDARLRGQTLSLFDDAAPPAEERQSSAEYLKVNSRTRSVSLIRRFKHSPPLLADAAGSTQTLQNGNVFVGWGELPDFSEYTASGKQILNGSFAFGLTSYRALRFHWVGQPDTRPSLAVSRRRGETTVYASWNGASQVSAWRVLGGARGNDLKPLGVRAPRRGFETEIRLTSGARYLAVQALGPNGTVLATSASARG